MSTEENQDPQVDLIKTLESVKNKWKNGIRHGGHHPSGEVTVLSHLIEMVEESNEGKRRKKLLSFLMQAEGLADEPGVFLLHFGLPSEDVDVFLDKLGPHRDQACASWADMLTLLYQRKFEKTSDVMREVKKIAQSSPKLTNIITKFIG